jgi:phage tail tape-measure protein
MHFRSPPVTTPLGVVGVAVGDAVGEAVGDAVGEAVGDAVGEAVGDAVGEAVGVASGSPQLPIINTPIRIIAKGIIKSFFIFSSSL